jgi:Flp pilus assembly protein TadB
MIYLASIDQRMALVCLGLSSLAGVLAGWWWVTVMYWPRKDEALPGIELNRRKRVREASSLFNVLEPVVLPFADKLEHTPGSTAQTMAKIRKTLDIVGLGFWSPGEWWAVKYVEGLFMGLAVGFFPLILGAPAVLGLVLGIGVLFGWPQLALASEVSKAEKHKRDVVYQLVYGLDLMSLMMEAGAGTFQECLQAVAMEVPESALGQEFSRVDARMDQGSTQQEALNELDERLLDPDIQSMVLSVNTSEEKGSKLKDTLGNLTEQMRQRRIQWLEKAAEEAKVHITWPAMCVMFACLILIAGSVILVQVAPTGKLPTTAAP